jgi:serine/threonine-protein kinase
MVARFHSCCTRDELQAAIARSTSDPSDLELEDHLAHCAVCREELERLAAAPKWWESAQSYLSDAERLKFGEDNGVRSEAGISTDHIRATQATVSAADRAQLLSWLPAGLLQPAQTDEHFGIIGAYEVVAPIGRGGMGVVLKAFDPALNRFVAIKVLAAEFAHNASARRRFAREAQAAAAVVHDHVVPIYAVDETGPNPYLVMAYIPGHSLQERIDETGPLDVREILRIGMQTATGLAAAHAQGLVHRDIKPANILLENGVERVRITDFGLARAMDEASQTQSGVLAGTPQYMAPEQASGEAIDYRTDLFSLGSMLYAMCTGHSPFRAETTVAVLRRICDGSPRPVREVNADIPDWLAAIIDKLLSKRPSDRYASAEEVARLLAEHLAQLQHPTSTRSSLRLKPIAVLGTAVSVLIAATVVLAIAWFQSHLPDSNDLESTQPDTRVAQPSGQDAEPSLDERALHTVQPLLDPQIIDAELRWLSEAVARLERQEFDYVRMHEDNPVRELDVMLDALENEPRVPAKISDR